jgi:hypothetical protein
VVKAHIHTIGVAIGILKIQATLQMIMVMAWGILFLTHWSHGVEGIGVLEVILGGPHLPHGSNQHILIQ